MFDRSLNFQCLIGTYEKDSCDLVDLLNSDYARTHLVNVSVDGCFSVTFF